MLKKKKKIHLFTTFSIFNQDENLGNYYTSFIK